MLPIAVSMAGLALIPVLVLQSKPDYSQVSLWHNLVGALFSVICVLGIAAVFYPARCRGMFQRTQNPMLQTGKHFSSVRIVGHHPGCQKFAANRISIKGREVCAACSGLLVGAIIALVGAALQFFAGLSVVWGGVWLLGLGEIGMVLGLAQIKFAGYAKVIANIIFVVSSFVTLAFSDVLAGSLLVDFYVLGLIAFMLWVRILLSEWNNRRTCQMCTSCFQ